MFRNIFLKYNFQKWIYVWVIAGLLSGCTLNNQPSPEIEEETEIEEPIEEIKPVKGGELIFAIRKPTTLNPILSDDASIQPLFKLIFDPLVTYDKTHQPVPHLAESWNFDQGGLSLNIILKDGIHWHDGTPLTAKDVIFTLDTIKKSSTSPYKKYIENISYYKALDEKNVKITYKQFFSGAIYALDFPILPAHYYEGSNVLTTEKNMEPIGTGAYVFTKLIPNQEIQLEANQQWFKGDPYIQKAKALFTPNEETTFHTFEQRQINVLNMKHGSWQQYGQMENAKVYEYMIPYYDFIGFNFQSPKFQNVNIRKAVAYAIDKEALLEKLYLGHGVPVDTPLFPNMWYSPKRDLVFSYNQEQAKQLLENGGISTQSSSEQGGLNFHLLISNENPIRLQMAEEIKNMLGQVGIVISIDVVSSDVYQQRLEQGDFETFLGGWKLSPIVDFTFAFHSTQNPSISAGGKNYIRYQDPVMDQLLKDAFIAEGDIATKQAYQNLDQYIIDHLPYVSLYFQTSALVVDEGVHGSIEPTMHSLFENINSWFIYPFNQIEQSKKE